MTAQEIAKFLRQRHAVPRVRLRLGVMLRPFIGQVLSDGPVRHTGLVISLQAVFSVSCRLSFPHVRGRDNHMLLNPALKFVGAIPNCPSGELDPAGPKAPSPPSLEVPFVET